MTSEPLVIFLHSDYNKADVLAAAGVLGAESDIWSMSTIYLTH